MGQPEEHQDLIEYEGKQRSSYREIPEDFQLYQCLLLNTMKKTFNQKLPITTRAPFLKDLPRHRTFSTGKKRNPTLLAAPIPGTGKGFSFPFTHPHLHSVPTGTQDASPTAYLEHERHKPTPKHQSTENSISLPVQTRSSTV